MSKSLGNFLTIEEILKRMPPEALRLFLTATHYRSPLDFSEQGLVDASRGCMRLHETAARLEEALGAIGCGAPAASPAGADGTRGAASRVPGLRESGALPEGVGTFREQFVTAMDDDLNTARALGVLFEEVREINRLLDAGENGDAALLAAHRDNLVSSAGVLGVLRSPAATYIESEKGRHLAASGVDVAEIEQLIGERTAARKARDFRRADEIRATLLARGIALKDSAEGTTWSVV